MSEMSSKASMREVIAILAGPKGDFDTRESWLARAARNSGFPFRKVKSLYYGEPVSEAIKSLVRRVAEDRVAEDGRKEARSLADKFETIAGALNAADPSFHRQDIVALIHAARALRGLDRAGDS